MARHFIAQERDAYNRGPRKLTLILETSDGNAHSLFISGIDTATDERVLKDNAIVNRISALGDQRVPAVQGVVDRRPFNARWLMESGRMTTGQLSDMVDTIWESLQHGHTLLFCRQGKTRSCWMGAVAVMAFCKVSPQVASNHVRRLRAIMELPRDFASNMHEYIHALPVDWCVDKEIGEQKVLSETGFLEYVRKVRQEFEARVAGSRGFLLGFQ